MGGDCETLLHSKAALLTEPELENYLGVAQMLTEEATPPLGSKANIEVLTRALAQYPTHPDLHLYLAQARLDAGKLAEAEQDLMAAINSFPESLPMKFELAKVLKKLGKSDQCRDLLLGLQAAGYREKAVKKMLDNL